MSDSSDSNEVADLSETDFFSVREERDAAVEVQRTIDEINDLFETGALPEPPILPEMENDAANSSDSDSSDELTDSSEEEMEMEEIEDDFGLQRQNAPERINVMQAEMRKKADEIIKKSFPEEYSLKQLHALPKALRSRCSKRPRTGSFQDKIYLDAAYKFSDSCMTELTGHTGCVNALGWSSDDQFIVSGSDDKCINLYNALGKDRTPRSRFFTGHQSNIFQSKFMPNQNNRKIVSCARDGAVRLTELDNAGCPVRLSAEEPTKVLVKHQLSAHKLSFVHGTSVILSAGEDGRIYQIDHREPPRNPILRLDEKTIYAIDCQPNGYEFAVCGDFQNAKIFDRRNVTLLGAPERDIGVENSTNHGITCLRYNHTGTELLISTNDGEIHLMDIKESKVINTYAGHQNEQTIKGVNFYGRNSEFIVSGSDCGNLYIWDSKTASLVNSQLADGSELNPGVVNVLEPAKSIPLLATSGLDSEIKLWSPSEQVFLEDSDRVAEIKEKMTENIMSGGANRRSRFSFLDRLRLLEFMSRQEREAGSSENDDDSDDDEQEDVHPDCRQM